jgi:endonuclease/exonuclease/phosphatase family metal-dependent hydrolase
MLHRLSRLLFSVLFVASGLLFTGCAPKPAEPGHPATVDKAAAAPAALELAIMTFNIRFDTPIDGPNQWQHRRAMVVDVIRAQHADFVGLQEALKSQLDDIGPPEPYAQLGIGREGGDGGEFSAILYRKDRFSLGESGTFWLSSTPEVAGSKTWANSNPRICTWGRFTERTTGRSFYVFNTHLDHESQLARALGIELIAARIAARAKPDPVFLMGDLNSGEDNSVLGFITGKVPRASEGNTPATAMQLVDTFRAVHPTETVVGTDHPRFSGNTKGPKIDYIFAPPGTEVLEAEIHRESKDGRYPSDHFPLTTRIRLK